MPLTPPIPAFTPAAFVAVVTAAATILSIISFGAATSIASSFLLLLLLLANKATRLQLQPLNINNNNNLFPHYQHNNHNIIKQ
jgi:hypothetical protein